MPPDMGPPYEYPTMMTRPNSLYLPPQPYDVMVANPKVLTLQLSSSNFISVLFSHTLIRDRT